MFILLKGQSIFNFLNTSWLERNILSYPKNIPFLKNGVDISFLLCISQTMLQANTLKKCIYLRDTILIRINYTKIPNLLAKFQS